MFLIESASVDFICVIAFGGGGHDCRWARGRPFRPQASDSVFDSGVAPFTLWLPHASLAVTTVLTVFIVDPGLGLFGHPRLRTRVDAWEGRDGGRAILWIGLWHWGNRLGCAGTSGRCQGNQLCVPCVRVLPLLRSLSCFCLRLRCTRIEGQGTLLPVTPTRRAALDVQLPGCVLPGLISRFNSLPTKTNE